MFFICLAARESLVSDIQAREGKILSYPFLQCIFIFAHTLGWFLCAAERYFPIPTQVRIRDEYGAIQRLPHRLQEKKFVFKNYTSPLILKLQHNTYMNNCNRRPFNSAFVWFICVPALFIQQFQKYWGRDWIESKLNGKNMKNNVRMKCVLILRHICIKKLEIMAFTLAFMHFVSRKKLGMLR